MPTATSAAELTAPWIAPLQLRKPRAIELAAAHAAAFLADIDLPDVDLTGLAVTERSTDVCLVAISPGNGTTYRLLLARLTDDVADALGYNLVVSLPDFGACLPVTIGFTTPDYVASKMRTSGTDVHVVVAAFLTLLHDALDDYDAA